MRPARKLPVVSCLALSALVTLGSSDLYAQNLFERLFSSPRVYHDRGQYHHGRDYRPPIEQRRQQRESKPAARAAPRSTARIAAPSYHNYRAQGVVRVDFSALSGVSWQDVPDFIPRDSAFIEALHWLDGHELHAERPISDALVAHYRDHPAFIWVTGLQPNEQASDAMRILADAATHGLEPAHYTVSPPSPAALTGDSDTRMSELIRFEMLLSARLLRYIGDASGGRVDPNKLSGYHDLPVKPMDLTAVLADLSAGGRTRDIIEDHYPKMAEYRGLLSELETLRASVEREIVVDPSTFVRPGQSHDEFPKLLELIARKADAGFRTDYGELLSRHQGARTYSEELVPVIKAAQERDNLKPDGIIGPATVHALAGSSRTARIDKVLLAIERLRWHPSELGERRVFVNQPAFQASFIDKGREALSMRAIIGRTSNQTSFFYDEIERVDYNPYWGVPQSIIVNEMLPRLVRDPGYLDRAGYEVTDSKGRRIASSNINWAQYGARVPYNVRQTPSEQNALGELKIMFPNKHAIYMHDTPTKNLFQRDVRAFSHGCIRLQDPRGMAAAVLQSTREEIARKLKQGHSSQKVPEPIPVYIAYFTAWPDQTGAVSYYADVYGRDGHLKKALDAVAAARTPSG